MSSGAFGELAGLVGVDELREQRRLQSQKQFQEDQKRMDGRQLAATTAGRLIGEAIGGLGKDPAMIRAKAHDDISSQALASVKGKDYSERDNPEIDRQEDILRAGIRLYEESGLDKGQSTKLRKELISLNQVKMERRRERLEIQGIDVSNRNAEQTINERQVDIDTKLFNFGKLEVREQDRRIRAADTHLAALTAKELGDLNIQNAEFEAARRDITDRMLEADLANKTLSKDELTRLQDLNENLDPMNPADAVKIDQNNARINKLVEVVGRTAQDTAGKSAKKVSLEALLTTGQQLDRFKAVQASYDPDFLTLSTDIKQWSLNTWEYLGMPLAEDTKRSMMTYQNFKMRTIQNLNQYIKDVTGAQMSEHEAKRIKAGVPNMDMSPTEFKGAMDTTLAEFEHWHTQNLATARADGMEGIDASITARDNVATSAGLDVEEQPKKPGKVYTSPNGGMMR